MVKYKDLSKLSNAEINEKINDINFDLIKARITSAKGGKVKIKELKKTLARLLMLKNNGLKKSVVKKS